MRISNFLNELKRRNFLLYYFGWINIALFIFSFVSYFVDDTITTGVNTWIKPMKFALSVAIYSWTFGWLLHFLTDQRKQKLVSWGIVICMVVENTIITIQAGRGQLSHYNISSSLDATLFSLMGTFIGINTFLNLFVLILFFLKRQVTLEGYTLAAWRVGLLFFCLGAISGGMMISQMSHTVGGADGGPGIPFFNWSTVLGDIRSAHFVTLHGLQAIPLFASLVASRTAKPMISVIAFSLAYLAICVGLHWLALSGLPVLPIG